MCARKVASSVDSFGAFCRDYADAIEELRGLRNQHEHMHTQIASGEIGKGPIFLSIADEGDSMRFRDVKMHFTSVHGLIEGLYRALLPLFPNFDGESAPEPKGVLTLTISATAEVNRNEEG
jgi:hypothetical protein